MMEKLEIGGRLPALPWDFSLILILFWGFSTINFISNIIGTLLIHSYCFPFTPFFSVGSS
jgi:hypothetical protein